MTAAVRETIRRYDLFARVGGDEFRDLMCARSPVRRGGGQSRSRHYKQLAWRPVRQFEMQRRSLDRTAREVDDGPHHSDSRYADVPSKTAWSVCPSPARRPCNSATWRGARKEGRKNTEHRLRCEARPCAGSSATERFARAIDSWLMSLRQIRPDDPIIPFDFALNLSIGAGMRRGR
jgi:hypothetical protein